MRTLIDIYKERGQKVQPYFDNYEFYAKQIKQAFVRVLGKVEVYIFGSILEKKHSPYHSDIDILVVSPKTPRFASDRAAVKHKVFQELGFLDPFEAHLATPEEYAGWYRHLIKKKIKV